MLNYLVWFGEKIERCGVVETKEKNESCVSTTENSEDQNRILYLKFCSKKEFANDILNGKLYANTPEFFRKKEIETGERGQGDKNELTLTMDATEVEIKDAETGKIFCKISKAIGKFRYNADKTIPMVSFVEINMKDLKEYEEYNGQIEYKFPFSEEEFEEMENKFGKYCVIIGAHELDERIKETYKNSGIEYVFEPVRYVTPCSFEKMKGYVKELKDRFLYKDSDLKYQKEYRLVLLTKMPDDHYIRVGKLENACIVESSRLKNLRITMIPRSGVE